MTDAIYDGLIRKRFTPPEGWEVFRVAWVDENHVLIEGAVGRKLKSGPRKGRTTWDDAIKVGAVKSLVFSRAEIQAALAEYEATTGICHRCYGKARTLRRSSIVDGKAEHEYRPCPRCKGTGKSPVEVTP